ncbi:hypothetical protein SOVF_019430 [Spinacia oleracea]|nr:hypothetical protein SOVF_019430 [Spinacia oleracea]
MMAMGRKGGPRDTRPVDAMTGRILSPGKPSSSELQKTLTIPTSRMQK